MISGIVYFSDKLSGFIDFSFLKMQCLLVQMHCILPQRYTKIVYYTPPCKDPIRLCKVIQTEVFMLNSATADIEIKMYNSTKYYIF